MISLTTIFLIALVMGVLVGSGLMVVAVLSMKENKPLGVILIAAGLLIVLCPVIGYVLVLVGAQSM